MCGVVGGGGRRGWKFEGADIHNLELNFIISFFKRFSNYTQ